MMEHKCRHKCRANEYPGSHKVYFDRNENDGMGAWRLRSIHLEDMGLLVKHCPYCGLKLEPPTPEFDAEAFREDFKEAIEAFDKWHDKLWHEYAVALSERTDRLFMGEEPEPPDVIEVSKATLYDWIRILDRIIRRGDARSTRHAIEATRAIEAIMYD